MNIDNYYSNPFNSCEDNDDCFDNHDECNDNHERRDRCCGRRFNNRTNDEEVQRALKAFENQLKNTDAAIDCLNKVFNNLEDEIFEDRCCPSNRIKNILKAIQTGICDLDDDLQDIKDDVVCLRQAL